MADGDRTPLLGAIRAPSTVIHGEADPLIPVAAGHHLVQHLRGAVRFADAVAEAVADVLARAAPT